MTDMDRCVYCNAPGCIAGTAEHAADCPSVTHVYPYTEADAATNGGFVCMACSEPFQVGDVYVSVEADPKHPAFLGALDAMAGMGVYDADVEWDLCVGCAALGREVGE